MTFWETPEWIAYETACGDAPEARLGKLLASTWATQVVDLTQPEKALWRGLRKSYRSLIRAAERKYDLWVFGCHAPGLPHLAPIAMAAFREMHIRAAGRETRPEQTWRYMEEWLASGHGICVAASLEGTWVAFAYFYAYEGWAYYGSAVSEAESVNHALVWAAMRTLASRGVERLEMGWQGEATDAKGQQIEFFRRGFGGKAIPAIETLCASLQ